MSEFGIGEMRTGNWGPGKQEKGGEKRRRGPAENVKEGEGKGESDLYAEFSTCFKVANAEAPIHVLFNDGFGHK